MTRLESTANLHRWTEPIAFETARSHLTKAAKNWYLANLDSIKDWKSFRMSFSHTFTIEKSLMERWQDMNTRCQQRGEDTREYFFDKLRLCKALNLGLEEFKTQLAIGLWSKEISTAILSRGLFDMDDILRNIIELETLETTRRQRINANRDQAKQFEERRRTSGDDNNSSRNYNFPKPQRKDNTENTGNRECYRCHATDHLAKNCTIKREVKCYNCQQTGHIISKDCSKPKVIKKSEVNAVISGNENNSNSKYEKNVLVGNIKFDALIDQGSSDCLIKASLVLSHEFNFIKAASDLIGFGGGITRSNGIIIENLKVDDCDEKNIRFRVVPDTAQKHDIIIGRNFTELSQIVYYKIDNNLKFVYRENFNCFSKFPEVEPSQNRCDYPKSLESKMIPPATINFINVKIENEEFELPIINQSKNNVSIRAGEKLDSIVFSVKGTAPKLNLRRDPITDADITTGPSLDSEQKVELLELLNKYRVCSAMNDAELGCTHLIEMDIQEKPGSVPVVSRPYKVNET